MKKIFVYTVISVFVFGALYSVVYSANSNNGENGEEESNNSNARNIQAQNQTQTNEGAGVQTQAQNQGNDNALMAQEKQQIRAQTVTELKEMIQDKKQAMKEEIREMKEERKEVHQNQNEVMLAVHALLASEDLVGGIGPQVSEIAREFNNSVQATVLAEEKINSRNKFVKLFIGGDDEAADEIEQEVNKNRARIQNLNQLIRGCECDEEVRSTIQEQIMNTEEEQNRLENLAKNEKAKKGLFGWLKNIFRFGK